MKDLKTLKAQIKQPQTKGKPTDASSKKLQPHHTNQHQKAIPNHNRGNR